MTLFELLRWFGVAIIIFTVTYYLFAQKRSSGFGSFASKRTSGNTPALASFSTDLTQNARDGRFDPVIGREEEIMRVTQILTRRNKNNVILLGPPGVGKTAIAEGLALKIVTNDVPQVLKDKRILSLRVAELLAGTKYRGEFEQRIKRVVEEISQSNRSIILFVDEIHTVMQTKGAEGSVNLSDILKPALARGDLQLIGATTQKEYDEFIAPDETWVRRFQPVLVDEPSVEEAITILQGIKKNYEAYHKVQFTDEAIKKAVTLSHEYIKGRRLPDKAIDLIDEAAAMVNVQEGSAVDHAGALLHGAAKQKSVFHSNAAGKMKKELEDLRSQEQGTDDEKKLFTIRKKIVEQVKKIEEAERGKAADEVQSTVDVDDIKEIVAEWVGMKREEIH
ncbi:MAG: ATP-dependent Clp protease ATP-binding subunit [Candidatus Magasanikbacteria bacterium]|nr:ATP-dependent Clp protease ATP-binding subunit [Candidatus Magasanikbacteria bacterium]